MPKIGESYPFTWNDDEDRPRRKKASPLLKYNVVVRGPLRMTSFGPEHSRVVTEDYPIRRKVGEIEARTYMEAKVMAAEAAGPLEPEEWIELLPPTKGGKERQVEE